jgi:hypothetical protein
MDLDFQSQLKRPELTLQSEHGIVVKFLVYVGDLRYKQQKVTGLSSGFCLASLRLLNWNCNIPREVLTSSNLTGCGYGK